jgi:hypothetical protein
VTIKTKSLALQLTLSIGCLVAALGSPEAAAEDAGPVDAYGRPLTDQLGPISYLQDGENWIALHADGSVGPAPAIDSHAPVQPPADSVESGYRLDPFSYRNVGSYASGVAIGDVTGDGRADVVLITSYRFDPVNDYSVFLFPQQADGTLGAPLKFSYLVPAGLPGIVLADLDEDGILDVVVGHDTGITVLLADGYGSLKPGVVTHDADATLLESMDVDRDGHVDIISLGQSRGGTIFFGDGRGGFSRTLPLATNARGFNDLELADLNGDGFADLAVLDGERSPTVNLSVHRNDGVGGFVSPPDTYSVNPSLWRAGMGAGDVSGDRMKDVVVSRPMNRPTWLWIMVQDRYGNLRGPSTIPSYDIPEPVAGADLDGDGREDLVVLHGGWNRVGVYLQKPEGGLGSELLFNIPYASHYSPQGLAIGDITSDGCPDVAIADYGSGLVVLHGSGCVPRCQPGLCDDGNPCTDDSCDPATGCVRVINTRPCDDGDACTTNDICDGGYCRAGTATDCNDNNSCTDDSCNPASGCAHANNANACDDGNACTTHDTCGGGACVGGAPLNCDDDNCCTADSCSPASGCHHAATPPPTIVVQPSLDGGGGSCPSLWPPNHGYVDFGVADTGIQAAAVCGGLNYTFSSCSSSQSENQDGTGDGSSVRDCVYEPGALHLRAERDGTCSPLGRTYTMTMTVSDACGQSTTSARFTACVWHDKEHGPDSSLGRRYSPAPGSDQNDTRPGIDGSYGSACGNGCGLICGEQGQVHDPSDDDRPNLTLTALLGGVVRLDWALPGPGDPYPPNADYEIWRRAHGSGPYTKIGQVPHDVSTFTDTQTADGVDYDWSVNALY